MLLFLFNKVPTYIRMFVEYVVTNTEGKYSCKLWPHHMKLEEEV